MATITVNISDETGEQFRETVKQECGIGKGSLAATNCMTEATEPLYLIDSNVLVYGYDQTDPQKHKIAQKLLEQCWKKTRIFAISSQNLAEFFVIVTKKIPHPLSLEEAEQIIADIIHFSHWHVLRYDEQTLLK